MMAKTKIEWSDLVWNPVTGCTPVSEGCANCYARRFAYRLRGRFGYPADDPFRVTLRPERLVQPYRWRRGVVFVCSMGDLFHEDVPRWFIQRVLDVAADELNANKIFVFLTKRPERMVKEIKAWQNKRQNWGTKLGNWWLGTSVENQQRLLERLRYVCYTPVLYCGRFISFEPLLGEIDLITAAQKICPDLCDKEIRPLDLVIVGAETGAGRRPCDINRVRRIRDNCAAYDIPFFLKQVFVNGKKTHELDGVDYSRIPPSQVFGGT